MICFGDRAGRSAGRRAAPSPRSPAVTPEQRLGELGLPVALDAGDADDLAAARPPGRGRRRPCAPLGPATDTPSQHQPRLRRAAAAGSLSTSRLTARPTISSASWASESVGLAVPTTLPRRITVILSAIARTSRSLWVMKTIALPSSRSDRITVDQLVDLLRRQHRGRLVEDQVLGVVGQRLQDLHPLLDADRQVLDQRVRVDVEPVALGELADRLPRLPHVQHAGGAVLPAEDQVLGHGEHLDQHEVLVHHADAGGDRLLGVARRRVGGRR